MPALTSTSPATSPVSVPVSVGSGTRPLADQLTETLAVWASSQHRLIDLSAEFADSTEWFAAGYPTAAHWIADAADIEPCTAREWIRIGRQLQTLPATADAFATSEISYSKVRTLTRHATAENEAELLELARRIPAAYLGRAIAAWFRDNLDPTELDQHHHQQRSVTWRTEPDGMVNVNLRLPPILAGVLIALLTTIVMRNRRRADKHATVAQQRVDALEQLLTDRAGTVDTELIIHVGADGATLTNGTPLTESSVAELAPTAFIRALVHDANNNPVDATNTRRHPTTRQKRLVAEQHQHRCVDCGRQDLLQYDHQPAHEQTGHTITTELKLRCAPCHTKRHQQEASG